MAQRQLGDSGDTFTVPSRCNNFTNLRNGDRFWWQQELYLGIQPQLKQQDLQPLPAQDIFVNTTGGAIYGYFTFITSSSVDVAVVAVADYAKTFDTDAFNTRSEMVLDKISGAAVDSLITTEGIAVTLVYVDATKGWISNRFMVYNHNGCYQVQFI